MTTTMIGKAVAAEVPKEDRLRKLVEEIVAEEESFQEESERMRGDDLALEERHRLLVDRLGTNGFHCRLRSAHEGMFKVHRKIRREHQQLVQQCLHLARELRRRFYTDQELDTELDRLSHVFQRMKQEHRKIEQERIKILMEHEEITAGLNGVN